MPKAVSKLLASRVASKLATINSLRNKNIFTSDFMLHGYYVWYSKANMRLSMVQEMRSALDISFHVTAHYSISSATLGFSFCIKEMTTNIKDWRWRYHIFEIPKNASFWYYQLSTGELLFVVFPPLVVDFFGAHAWACIGDWVWKGDGDSGDYSSWSLLLSIEILSSRYKFSIAGIIVTPCESALLIHQSNGSILLRFPSCWLSQRQGCRHQPGS